MKPAYGRARWIVFPPITPGCMRSLFEITSRSVPSASTTLTHTRRAGFATNQSATDRALSGKELDGRVAPPGRAEAAHVLLRSARRVLLGVRALYGVADPLGPRAARSNANLTVADLNRAERVVEKRAVPAAALLHPRSREHAALDDDGPDADEAVVRAAARADAKDLALVDRRGDPGREAASPTSPRAQRCHQRQHPREEGQREREVQPLPARPRA